MEKWTSAIGYPVVTVEETAELGTSSHLHPHPSLLSSHLFEPLTESFIGKYKVTQNRFLASGDVKPEEDTTIWNINIGISSKSHPQVFPYALLGVGFSDFGRESRVWKSG